MTDEEKRAAKLEAFKGKQFNLKDITPEQRSVNARNAAAISNRKQAHKRKLSEAAKILLWHPLSKVPDEREIVLTLRQMGVEDPTGADAIMLAQYVKARRGDTEAARFIRDTAGEKPSQQVEVNLVDKPLDAIDFAALDDDQLEALAAARNMTLIAGPVIDVEPVELAPSEQRPAKPEGLLWDAKGEIDYEKELSKPPMKKRGRPPITNAERARRREEEYAKLSPEEREERLKEDAEQERVKAEKKKAKAEKKAKEEADLKAALEERFGTSDI